MLPKGVRSLETIRREVLIFNLVDPDRDQRISHVPTEWPKVARDVDRPIQREQGNSAVYGNAGFWSESGGHLPSA